MRLLAALYASRRGGLLAVTIAACAAPTPTAAPRVASSERRPAAVAEQRPRAPATPPVRPVSAAADTRSPDARSPSAPLAPALPAACPRTEASEVAGELVSDALDEVSGMVASRKHAGVLWVHNDSGDGARVFAIDARGRLHAEVLLEGAQAHDYEDLALAPSLTGADTLYVADTGDNGRGRARVALYAFAEPDLSASAGRIRAHARRIEVRYEDGPHDVETLLVDPRTGDLFLVEKGPLLARRQPVGVYRIAAAEAAGKAALARLVAKVALGPVTAGDVLPDGSGVALRNYTHALFWPRAADEPLERVFAGEGCPLPLSDWGEQGESFAFSADGRAFLTVAEGVRSPIHRTPFTPRGR